MWVGTSAGRLFISHNADSSDPTSVTYTRIDSTTKGSVTPGRFIDGIAVDPKNANHAFVSFSGFGAYTPDNPGHVFSVVYNPTTQTATWTDLTGNMGDLPINGIAYNSQTGDLYAATDYGVIVAKGGTSTWQPAAYGLPQVAIYSLTLDPTNGVLYAATHGRGIWKLSL
jgi:hypothetical protein